MLGKIASLFLAEEMVEEPSLRVVRRPHSSLSSNSINYWVTLGSSTYILPEFCHLQEYLSPHLVGT